MQSEKGSRPVPQWLQERHPVAYRTSTKRTLSVNGVLAAITVALLIAASITFYLRPANSANAFAYVAPVVDEVSDADEVESTPKVQLREREFVTERSIEWVRGSVDIPFPPKPAIESAHTVPWHGTVPIGTMASKSETSVPSAPHSATTTVAHVSTPPVKAVVEAPKTVVKKVAQPAAAHSASPANPCGTMQHCIAATAKDPNVVHTIHACRAVLNGRGSASARAACDSIFAMSVPAESDVPDDQRKRAATVCRGMPKCSELVMKRPSAAQLVQACGTALIRGSGPEADKCDRVVMSRI
jgi:hypothetical protein